MTKIECKIVDLKRMAEFVGCKGKGEKGVDMYLTKDFLIDAKGNSVEIQATDTINQALLVKLKYNDIKVINEGQIPIGSVEQLVKILNRYNPNDKVTVEYLRDETSSKMWIKRGFPKMSTMIPVPSPDNIDSVKGIKVLEGIKYDDKKDVYYTSRVELSSKIVLEASHLKSILPDADALPIDLRDVKYPIELKGGKLLTQVGNENDGIIEREIPTKEVKGEGKSLYKFGFDAIFTTVDGDISIYFANEGPMVVVKTDDKFELMYFIAPTSGWLVCPKLKIREK